MQQRKGSLGVGQADQGPHARFSHGRAQLSETWPGPHATVPGLAGSATSRAAWRRVGAPAVSAKNRVMSSEMMLGTFSPPSPLLCRNAGAPDLSRIQNMLSCLWRAAADAQSAAHEKAGDALCRGKAYFQDMPMHGAGRAELTRVSAPRRMNANRIFWDGTACPAVRRSTSRIAPDSLNCLPTTECALWDAGGFRSGVGMPGSGGPLPPEPVVLDV